MRFLLDVHVAASIRRSLVSDGHDVLAAADAHADWTDARLLELAVAQRRIIVTADRDFSDLIYRAGMAPPPAFLYIRCDPASQANLADRLPMVLANTRIEGHMLVIRPTSVRHRPLPKQSEPNG